MSPGMRTVDSTREFQEERTLTGRRPSPPAEGDGPLLARLIILDGEQVGRKYVIGAEASIGRSEDASIHLLDAKVSRHHAQLTRLPGGGYLLEDSGSRNGTAVNGQAVTRCELQFGDRIQVGGHMLLFTHHDPLQDQALQRQKLEAVGRLGAGIAHDFNNLLGAAISTLDYVSALPVDRTLGDPEVRACIADIRSAAYRATELTRRLLGFSRRGRAEHVPIDVSSLCHEVVGLLTRTIGQSIKIQRNIENRLVVHGHQGELHQVLMNLCINARDAMPDGGELTLKAALRRADELAGVPLSSKAPHVVMTVGDTGKGMDEETRKSAFEPFFTTKKGEAGAGLGLPLVYDIVTGHGGTVTLDSSPGQGSTFTVYLPASESRAVTTRTRATTGRLRKATGAAAERQGTILVVDDETLVRRSLGRLLSRVGYTVSYASNGQEAIALIQDKGPPDLVLLDLDMPELDGLSTLRHIRASLGELPVICISGHWDEPRERELRALGVVEILEKPYDSTMLLELVSASVGPPE